MSREKRPTGLLKTVLAVTVAASVWVQNVAATSILKTSGFENCGSNADVQVQTVDIEYNNDNQTVTFDVAGSSSKVQNVTAMINVTAYGIEVYSNTFNPCASSTFVEQLCPVPAGNFSASGTQAIPSAYAKLVPSIAYQVPDIAAQATLQLMSTEDGTDVACIQSQVTNGKTVDLPAVSYVAVGVAGAALVLGGVSAVGVALAGGSGLGGGSAAMGGVGAPSPSFTEVFGWFQGMAMNGMLSVSYPQVYRSFSKNFAFSTGLVPWTRLQTSIDSFRAATGGNLTNNSVEYLENATLVFPDGSTSTLKRSVYARSLQQLLVRAIETSINGTDVASGNSTTTTTDSDTEDSVRAVVSGIEAFVEELSIPSANTFMTVLLIVAIVIAAITVGLLLLKVVLEVWSLVGRFPDSLTRFREHYWRSIGHAITTLILLLYGVWVLYCMFQFTRGDSWAAKLLAGVTLALFTGILAFFSFRIGRTAKKLRAVEGDVGGLYDDQGIWDKYSLFYESYRRRYWWIFLPTIIYMFAKGVVLAVGDGHGLAQTVAQMVIEIGMLLLLLWSRPYERRSGNVINVIIQVVRVLSIVCIFVFVDEFDIAETTQTVAGVVLIVIQSVLSGVLAILIAWNALIACCKENPHKRRRRELEKARDMDALTPLDARNSLLLAGPNPLMNEKSVGFSVANIGDSKFASSTDENRIKRLSSLSSSAPSIDIRGRPGAAAAMPGAATRMPPPRMQQHTNTVSTSSRSVPIGLATTDLNGRPLTPSTFASDADDALLSHAAPIGHSGALPSTTTNNNSNNNFSSLQPTLPDTGFDFTGSSRGPASRNDYRPTYSPFPGQQQANGGYRSYNAGKGGYGGPWQPQRGY